jgi:parvulin-like peptidyl-prolyl isomerase
MVVGKKVLAIFLIALSTAGQASAELVDAVVATVDKEVILQSEIINEIRPALAGLGGGEAEAQELFDAALEQAIDQKILYREGVLNDIQITDEQLEERLKRYRDQFESEDAFLKALADAGETISDLRERIRKQTVALSMGMSKRMQLEKEVSISEAEVAQYYQDNADSYQRPERVKLYRIFIAAEKSEASRAKALARIEALREELSLGADFSQLAIQHSEGPAAAEGGLVGWIERGELVPELENVAFSLTPGDISPVIETEFGMMLLKVEEKVDAGLATFEEVRTDIEPTLRQNYADEKYKKWMSELRKRSRVRKYQ